jgi:putative copper export protein
MADVLFVLMRWLHFASMATLVGGIIFARLVMTTSLGTLAPDARDAFGEKSAAAYRPLVMASILGLIVSGTYNLLTNPGHTPKYHMVFGIKILLVLHVFAVALLITQPKNPKRARMMTGTIVSGLIILAISAYLRHIF